MQPLNGIYTAKPTENESMHALKRVQTSVVTYTAILIPPHQNLIKFLLVTHRSPLHRISPRAGSAVVRIDPLCFLAGCRLQGD